MSSMKEKAILNSFLYERVAQLVEHLTFNQVVESSSLSTLTILEPSIVTVAIFNALLDVGLTILICTIGEEAQRGRPQPVYSLVQI